MVHTESESREKRSGVSRRRFVQAAGASGIAVGIAGCLGGGNGNGGDENAVVLSSDQNFADSADPIRDALYEAGLDESIDVEVEAGDFETDQRQSEYSSALNAGRSSPDIFMMDSGWTIPFIVREQLVNLSEELSSDVADKIENEYVESAVSTAKHPESGDLYGVPLFPDFPTMLYRKDLVQDAGYDDSNWATEPMSWQEFSEIAADVRDQSDVEYGFVTQADAYEGLSCCTFNETMTSFGGAYFGGHENLFGPVGDRPITVNEEPVHETIRAMRAMIYGSEDEEAAEGYSQCIPDAAVQWTEEDARGPFDAGNAVFQRNWPYAIVAAAADDVHGENLGVMPLPYGVEEGQGEYEGTGGTSAALGGWHLTINPNSEKQDQALQVLEAFVNEDVMLTIFEEQGNIPPIIELLDDVSEEDVGPIARYTDQLQVAGENSIPRPVTDIWPQQSALVYQEVHDAYTQTKTPEEAMETLEQQLQDSESE